MHTQIKFSELNHWLYVSSNLPQEWMLIKVRKISFHISLCIWIEYHLEQYLTLVSSTSVYIHVPVTVNTCMICFHSWVLKYYSKECLRGVFQQSAGYCILVEYVYGNKSWIEVAVCQKLLYKTKLFLLVFMNSNTKMWIIIR